MYWLIHSILLFTLAILTYRIFQKGITSKIFYGALTLKLSAGIALGLVYQYWYSGGDTFDLFEQAIKFSEQPAEQYWQLMLQTSDYSYSNNPRSLFFSKLLSLFVKLTNRSYWLSSMYLSLFSFLGSMYAVIQLIRYYPSLRNLIIVCFLFVPSFIFWSSGILKDSLATGALMFLSGALVKVYNKSRFSFISIILIILSIFLLFKLKHYLLITILLFSGSLFFLKWLQHTSIRIKITAWMAILIVTILSQNIHPYLNLQRLPLTLFENNRMLIKKTDRQNSTEVILEDSNWKSVAKKVPMALKVGLFGPTIIDKTSNWGLIHKIENFLFLSLFFMSLVLYLKERPPIDLPIILSMILAICLALTLLSLATPNFGTLVRYKTPFIPFLFLLVSMLPYWYFSSEER